MVAPHYLIVNHFRLCLVATVASIVLSLWALHLDPVINNDGILYLKAAQHFGEGQWGAGIAVYKWPFYSLLIGIVSGISGLAEGHSAYLLNSALYVALILGFLALVRALGGGNAALWSAAIIALAHPVLNEFRSFIIRDIGYWACFLWSLAYFFTYLRNRRPALLLAWAILALMAFLFRIEGVVLLAVLPACLYLTGARGGRRITALSLLLIIGAAVIAASPLWHYISEIETSREVLIANPLQHIADSWHAGSVEVLSRLGALRREFTGIPTSLVSFLIYLCTVVLIAVMELIESLGIVFTGLAVYASWRITALLPDRQRQWWLIVVLIQGLLVLSFVFSNFFLAERYPVGLALVILAIVPLSLEEIWEARVKRSAGHSWRYIVIAVLLTIEAIDGLDVATEKQYIKDAGLWMRQHTASDATIYSNNRILIYYSGLREPVSGGDYSWQEAMSEIWTDHWRKFDFFVLVMGKREAQNEVLLFQKVGIQPVKTFSSSRGDRVLIFRP